jgi:hypothetical protein
MVSEQNLETARKIGRKYGVELEVYHTDELGKAYVKVYFKDPGSLKDFFTELSRQPEIGFEIQHTVKLKSSKTDRYIV